MIRNNPKVNLGYGCMKEYEMEDHKLQRQDSSPQEASTNEHLATADVLSYKKKLSLPLHQKEGILLVNKEKERTAFHLVKVLRKKTGIAKIGHAGILDPFATGVMVMLIGRTYTKLSHQFIQDDKEYEGIIKLGEETTTFDCEGEITKKSSYIPSFEEVQMTIAAFQGKMLQIPPMFSAKKVGGRKLYLLARQGIEIERKPAEIQIETILISYCYPLINIRVVCSKGTYIRTLAKDIGDKLGTYGHLTTLTRVRSGSFKLEDCIDAKFLAEPSFSYIPYLRKAL